LAPRDFLNLALPADGQAAVSPDRPLPEVTCVTLAAASSTGRREAERADSAGFDEPPEKAAKACKWPVNSL
jgi:hypothetical protein